MQTFSRNVKNPLEWKLTSLQGWGWRYNFIFYSCIPMWSVTVILARGPGSGTSVWINACIKQWWHKLKTVIQRAELTSLPYVNSFWRVNFCLRCVKRYETFNPNRPPELYKFLHGGKGDAEWIEISCDINHNNFAPPPQKMQESISFVWYHSKINRSIVWILWQRSIKRQRDSKVNKLSIHFNLAWDDHDCRRWLC